MKTTKAVHKDLIKYDIETAVITGLDKKYKDVKITNGESYAVVMFGLGEYRGLRVEIDNKHKELKKDVLEYGRAIDAEKNRLKDLLEPGENHLKGIRKVWDDEKDRIKEEKAAQERKRVAAIQEKINSIRDLGMMQGKDSSAIKERLTLVTGIEISKDIYQEYMPYAIETHKDTIDELEKLLNDRLQFEKEEVERKAEAERLEVQRKEQEAAQAKIDEANKEIEEEKKRLEREELERQNKKQVEELADKWAKEKADREEAEAKEKERQEALAPDKEKLTAWINSFNLDNNPTPSLKSKKAKEILRIAMEQIELILQDAEEKAQKL